MWKASARAVLVVFASLGLVAFAWTSPAPEVGDGPACESVPGEVCCNCLPFGDLGILCFPVEASQSNPGSEWRGYDACNQEEDESCPAVRSCEFGGIN
jgi:hypothetical protein